MSEVDKTSELEVGSFANSLKAQTASDYHLDFAIQDPSDQHLPREANPIPDNSFAEKRRMVNNEPVILEEAEVKDQKGNVIPTEGIVFIITRTFANSQKSSDTVKLVSSHAKNNKKSSKTWLQKPN